ncbi:putative phage abortive infection protein [Actinobacillus pleuropneumoniae]|uniref:putative phage abortive infection protein n=1 Tax=Actinobacillus pleuropneumoniae TaxID=715 RepID=UPI001C0131A4|nr:putative phage abortive infection protein [Actinobacillus pleuropneumoniae]MBT9343465.1 putative phage abortive infection protein [Actinobacillus pleuropneumoniae]
MLKEIIDFIKNHKWYVLLVVGLLGLYFYQFHGGLSSESEKWDHFGSYIGGIFSAVTLLSVLHGMQLERKRFNDQKIEFENEKKEQEEYRRKEEFEGTFFMLLEEHNNKLRFLENKENGIDGKSIVDNVYKYLEYHATLKEIRFYLERGYSLYADMNVYFLNLYHILKYIDENSRFNVNNRYSSLLRSFLSRKVLYILAYHLCDRNSDFDNYINYIKKFHFLEHMSMFDLEVGFLKVSSNYREDAIYRFLSGMEVFKKNNYSYLPNSFTDEAKDNCSNWMEYYLESRNEFTLSKDNCSDWMEYYLESRNKFTLSKNKFKLLTKYNIAKDCVNLKILKQLHSDAFLGNMDYLKLIHFYQEIINE